MVDLNQTRATAISAASRALFSTRRNIGLEAAAVGQPEQAVEQVGRDLLAGNLVAFGIVKRPCDVDFHLVARRSRLASGTGLAISMPPSTPSRSRILLEIGNRGRAVEH